MKNSRILCVFATLLTSTAFGFSASHCHELARSLNETVKIERHAQKIIAAGPVVLTDLLKEIPNAIDHVVPKDEVLIAKDHVIERKPPADVEKLKKVEEIATHKLTEAQKSEFIKCFKKTGTLVGMSTIVTTAFTLLVTKHKYADDQIARLFRVDSVKKAFKDPWFQQQLVFNGLIMSAVGMSACYNTVMGQKGVFTVSGALSSIGQLATKGTVSVPQLALDALWTTFISTYKTKLALKASKTYKDSGKPGAYAMECFFQALSETIGAVGKPLANLALEWFLIHYFH